MSVVALNVLMASTTPSPALGGTESGGGSSAVVGKFIVIKYETIESSHNSSPADETTVSPIMVAGPAISLVSSWSTNMFVETSDIVASHGCTHSSGSLPSTFHDSSKERATGRGDLKMLSKATAVISATNTASDSASAGFPGAVGVVVVIVVV